MDKAKVLVVEDDRVIAEGLVQVLEATGYEVIWASDGEQGLYEARTQAPDVIILDIMMPEMNGFEVTTELRRQGDHVPIIVLSARTETGDKVRGLDLGADDYLTKPFDLDELLARVRRQLKKNNEKKQEFGGWEYSWQERLLKTKAGEPCALNTKERKLLEFFLKRKNQIVSREQILDAVWGADYDGTDRTVDNLVVALRKKIGGQHLLTERGLGYRFVTNS